MVQILEKIKKFLFDIFNENPFDFENSKPFTSFPPKFKRVIFAELYRHFSNS